MSNSASKKNAPSAGDATFSMLLASSVHDVKNVLGSVLESVDWMICQSNPTDEQAGELQKINQLVALVNSELMQLLCVYKFENQQFNTIKLPVSLDEFLEMQVAFLSPLLAGKNISLDYVCDEEDEGVFDETLLASAVRNAAMNAMKFAKSKILLTASLEDDSLIFTVEDDGPGFPGEMLGVVSGRKAAADFTTGSTGLGLYFAEIVATLHQTANKKAEVRLSNESQLGGAAFIIHIPQ